MWLITASTSPPLSDVDASWSDGFGEACAEPADSAAPDDAGDDEGTELAACLP